MITKLIDNGQNITYRAVNTDCAVGLVGEDVGIGQPPEETGDRIWVLDAIQYSYKSVAGVVATAKPVTGGIDIYVGEKLKWSADIPDFTGVINLYMPGQADKLFSVLLKGTDGYIGKLNVQWHLEPAQ